MYTLDSLPERVSQGISRGSGARAGDKLVKLGHRFGDWLDNGPNASPATVQAVESIMEDALREAARTGRLWGILEGILLGALLSMVALGVAELIAVIV